MLIELQWKVAAQQYIKPASHHQHISIREGNSNLLIDGNVLTGMTDSKMKEQLFSQSIYIRCKY